MFLLHKPNFIGAFQSLDANFKPAAGLSAVIAMPNLTLSRPASICDVHDGSLAYTATGPRDVRSYSNSGDARTCPLLLK
jgi:hypothetical protein